MEDFLREHQQQLAALQIPAPLHRRVKEQLEAIYTGDFDHETLVKKARTLLDAHVNTPYGSILILPHLCAWDMDNHRGLWQELSKLSDATLTHVYRGLLDVWEADSHTVDIVSRSEMMEHVCLPQTWSQVILYRRDGSVRAALPAPPYYPQVQFDSDESDWSSKEADLTGPFPFQYRTKNNVAIDTSLIYLSPGASISQSRLPTLDLVPSFMVPDELTRAVRYVALFLDHQSRLLPPRCLQLVKDYFEDFQRQWDNRLESHSLAVEQETPHAVVPAFPHDSHQVLRVYTDTGDPIGLAHPEAGLTDARFQLVDSISDADIVFSYQSLFASGRLQQDLATMKKQGNPVLINQFPYEGAMVQKDHLARELWKQYGSHRPPWAIEGYDLDVHLAAFVGAALEARERNPNASRVWIAKPARGTQSKGHLVTRSTAHILRLRDCGATSYVVQRYIERPLCYEGRKLDCRCIVLLTSAAPESPQLYVHNRLFFRIARKPHRIVQPSDLVDPEKVLTATHLVPEQERSSSEPLPLLPVDYKTISHLEDEHGLDWKSDVLPKIHTMIRELFGGMTRAFPAMERSTESRAVYGVDAMFEVTEKLDGPGAPSIVVVEPKLTEVTFCPANNAICDAYERDDDLYRSYLNDIFNCLFRGEVSPNLTKL